MNYRQIAQLNALWEAHEKEQGYPMHAERKFLDLERQIAELREELKGYQKKRGRKSNGKD